MADTHQISIVRGKIRNKSFRVHRAHCTFQLDAVECQDRDTKAWQALDDKDAEKGYHIVYWVLSYFR